MNPVFGIFQIDSFHNGLLLVTAIAAFVMSSRGEPVALLFCKIFGVVFGLLALLGIGLNGDIVGLTVVSMPDTALHLIIGIALLYVGFGESVSGAEPGI